MSLSELYKECNHTELYQLCRRHGIVAHPTCSRETLCILLAGEEESNNLVEEDHPIDAWRHALMGFIEEYWSTLEPQITCPAKSRDPRACFGCVDAQVVTCVVTNQANEKLIQLHLPRRAT